MENNEKVRLVISDVDGTLLNPEGDLSPVNYVAVARLQQAGVKFSLASARPRFGMQWLVKMLEVRSACAGLNGAIIFSPGGEVHSELEVGGDLAEALLDRIRKRGFDVWVYTRDQWFVPKINGPHVRRNTDALRTDPIRYDSLAEIVGPILKLVAVSDMRDAMSSCAKELQKHFGEFVSASASQAHYLDITRVGADKGKAAELIAMHESVPLEAVLSVGDSTSDVPMFGVTGKSVAMGQASMDVQHAASRITRPNTANGFAWAAEYALGRKEFTTVMTTAASKG